MSHVQRKTTVVLAALAIGSIAKAASAETIFNTGDPDFGFFGPIGYDVFIGQSVGVSFTPTSDYTFDGAALWMMSNDFDNPGRTYTVSLRTNSSVGGPTSPGATLESWDVATAAVGWFDPQLEAVSSTLHPLLHAGQAYWIVADSTEQPFVDPVWVWGSTGDPVYSNFDEHDGNGWQAGGYTQGSAPGVQVYATLAPAPASVGMIGLAGLAVARRRRR